MVENFKGDEKIAGVCGKLTLSNFKFFSKGCSNTFYFLSTMFVVGYQFYEYHYNQIVGKQSEAAYSAVSCLPGAFSVFRSSVLTNVETRIGERVDEQLSSTVMNNMGPFSYYYFQIKQTLPLVLDDFFSKPTVGIIDRNLYELGEDRTLTIRFLQKGLKCLYEPRAVAYTECPDSIVKYFQQRRRWNNSTFVNLAAILTKGGLWCQFRTIPIQIFSFFDLFGAYILPANALLLMYVIWNPMFRWISDHTGVNINVEYVLAALLIVQALVIMTTNIATADMFYVFITFIQGLLMLAATPFFVLFIISIIHEFESDMIGHWAPIFILALFPLMHTIMSVTLPPAFFTVIYWWAMIPTSALTLPFYSFVHLDDFSWGNR
jgi:cellulose synthase/poly-beta-1,6-N-acetylglucosamine synthase-like glycosyltransferase